MPEGERFVAPPLVLGVGGCARMRGTTRLRDYKTTRPQKNPGVLRHSQAFSAVRGCARQCEASWRQSGADVVPSRSLAGWGCTWAYIPIQTNELGATNAPLSRQEWLNVYIYRGVFLSFSEIITIFARIFGSIDPLTPQANV